MIKRKDGTFVEDTVNCNGQNDLAIVTNKYCLVPMALLTSSSGYNLQLGDLIIAKVAAINFKGQG
jgi:hypothetical protein